MASHLSAISMIYSLKKNNFRILATTPTPEAQLCILKFWEHWPGEYARVLKKGNREQCGKTMF
eukprot:1160741-Pelagomonas_calceolata.AAC.17